MSAEKRLHRDVGLKPRTCGDLPPEKLEQILSKIYSEETVTELMSKLCDIDGGSEDGS